MFDVENPRRYPRRYPRILRVYTYKEFQKCKDVKARLHGRFLSQQLDAIFVALKLQLQNRTCKLRAIFIAICRRDIAGVSNMFET